MNLDHNFFQVSKLSEDQKKGVRHIWKTFFLQIQVKTKKKGLHQNWKTFSPRIQMKTSAQMQAKVELLGDTVVDHTQIIGKDKIKLLGGIYPPIPPGFRHPCLQHLLKHKFRERGLICQK